MDPHPEDELQRREKVLEFIRCERRQQIARYGHNAGLELGFGGTVSPYPWLRPYTDESNVDVCNAFREDYDDYEQAHGQPTWMHLIREEVAELFETTCTEDAITEAVQAAALCVSLVENLLNTDR